MSPEDSLDLSVLEEDAQARKAKDESEEDDDDDDDDDMPFSTEDLLTDINEGLILIRRTRVMLDFLSDPELCKTITKRERDILSKLSERLTDYEDSVTTNQG